MSARVAVTLLFCSVIVATNVFGKSLQSFNELNSLQSSEQQVNTIDFNILNSANSETENNFNPLASSLVNRNSFPTSMSFGRPLSMSSFHHRRAPRIPAAQSNAISFGDNPSQQGGSLKAGTHGNTHVSLSSSPTRSAQPSQPTHASGTAISFGGGPVTSPSTASSTSSPPAVTDVPEFSDAEGGSTESIVLQTTSVNLDPSPIKGSPPIFFPGEVTEPTGGSGITDANTPNIIEDSNCMMKDGTVYFEGNCEILLSQASCPEAHWLLLDVTGSPYCAELQCPWGHLNYLGDCVDPGDHQVCKRGQILYVDFTGLVECDCEPDFVFDSVSDNCFGIHEQGFCEDAKYLERDQEGKVVCVSNPCVSDKYVEQDGVCYEKNYRGYCPQSQVMILPHTVTADCLFLVPHSIFQVQESPCPPGSKRDFYDQCKNVFRIPSQSSFPTLRGDCPSQFVKDPTGTCRKVVNLFG